MIAGLDVSRGGVTACFLDRRPESPRDVYRSESFFDVPLTSEGVNILLSMGPSVAVLEPTGNYYSHLWIHHLLKAGVEVRLVGHDKLQSYRHHLNLPNKDDRADALALGCYYFDYHHIPSRFSALRSPLISRIRQIALKLDFYAGSRTRIINRLKQELNIAFPEKAKYRTGRKYFDDAPPFWRWLAGDLVNSKYERELEKSCGLGLSDEITFDAQMLVDIFRQERVMESELFGLMSNDIFAPYLKVFAEFDFGLRVSSVIISQIFPLSKFMGADGLPEVVKEKGANGFTNRYLSERRFKSMNGLAPVTNSSGSRKRSFQSGNRLCRRVWWQWLFCMVEPAHARRTEISQNLGETLDRLKADGVPVKKARARVCAQASVLLFRWLCRVLT